MLKTLSPDLIVATVLIVTCLLTYIEQDDKSIKNEMTLHLMSSITIFPYILTYIKPDE